MPTPSPFRIFIVEDSDDDLFLFRRLLAKAEIDHPLAIATDGQQAIDQLSAILAARDLANLPRLVFLDLKLPLRSGFEVLQWIRQQPEFAQTVVIVLSSSAEARDVARAYELGAQGYLVKYPRAEVIEDAVRNSTQLNPETGLDTLFFPGLLRP